MTNYLYSQTKQLPEILEETEINKILNKIMISEDYPKSNYGLWMKNRDATLIATIYILGLRPKEACTLRLDDFNFKNSYVKIRGVNNKIKKDRVLPVPKILLNILKTYLNFPRARYWRGSSYLFPSAESPHISAGRLKHIFREKCLKPLGLCALLH